MNLGITVEEIDGIQHPFCVICKQRLSKHSMAFKKLQAHFNVHCEKDPRLIKKKPEYFKMLEEELNLNIQHTQESTSKRANLASFKVSYLIAKAKKPHNIFEELLMPACEQIVASMIGEEHIQTIKKVPSSAATVSRRISLEVILMNNLRIN